MQMDNQTSMATGTAPGTASTSSLSAGGGGPGANPASFAQRQHDNELTTKYYAAALSGIIFLFALIHWLRQLSMKTRPSSKTTAILSPFVTVSRIARRIFIRKIPGFTSVGHASLVLIYMALNLVLSFVPRYDWSKPTNFAARFGWMAGANLALVVFLALKNTPVAILTSYSYERLNCLHRVAGYTTTIYMILHSTIYCGYFIKMANWKLLHKDFVTAGIVLGFLMITTVVEATILQRLQYEIFYIIHVILFMGIIVTLGLHRPSVDEDKIAIVACIAAGLWVSDRAIRLTRLLYNSINNKAIIYPLPHGGTQILLKKPLACVVPGAHCFVWLPKIRLFESHPFTIVTTSPTELVVNSYSGFTKDLHKYAAENPGATLMVSLEGPYGKFPDPTKFDKVVMIAGGSGASFTFGLVSNMLQRMDEKATTPIDFIWIVKTEDHLSWFEDHFKAVRTHAHALRIALKLYTTKARAFDPAGSGDSRLKSTVDESNTSGHQSPTTPVFDGELTVLVDTMEDPEKADVRTIRVARMGSGETDSVVNTLINQGRPDVEALIKEAVGSVDKDKRVLIAACGPDGLMNVVRDTAASCIMREGPSVELHCEQFSW